MKKELIELPNGKKVTKEEHFQLCVGPDKCSNKNKHVVNGNVLCIAEFPCIHQGEVWTEINDCVFATVCKVHK